MPKVTEKRPDEQLMLTGRSFLTRYVNEQRLLLWGAVSAGILSTVLLLVQWVSFSFLAENIIIENQALNLYPGVLALFVCSVMGRLCMVYVQTYFAQNASLKIRNSIRLTILDHWRTMSPLSLKTQSAGVSATQWVEEVEAMDGYFSRYWPQQMLAVISPLLILCVVAWFNWLCALLLFISAPLIPLFMMLVGMGAEQLNQKYSSIRQRLAGHFLDRVANLTNIKLLGGEQAVFDEVGDNSNHYRYVVMKTLKIAFLSSTVLEFFTSVAIASLAIYIGFSLYGAITWGPAQSLTLFTGLLILILAPEFFQPLRNLSQYYHDRAAALGAANNLVLLLNPDPGPSKESLNVNKDTSKDLNSGNHSVLLPIRGATIKTHNLSIGYPGDIPLISDVNLQLDSGQMMVITGRSGAGKSTFLHTFAGYLPPLSGSISLTPTEDMPVAYLPQKAWIKNGTIYDNLAALAPDASTAQMVEVLDSLGLANELQLKHNGLDTVIQEHGQGLSGGQMQRIALARVLLNPAPVILLDEPTAKLDLTSKKFIIGALNQLKSKSILIVATHDPALLTIADVHLTLGNQEEKKDALLV
ncbi:MAG: ATP-binding cassette subfamily C protein CydD [Paraglaciecola sp.]|jgi:ATP-binding cassette subfamily C protein CydD